MVVRYGIDVVETFESSSGWDYDPPWVPWIGTVFTDQWTMKALGGTTSGNVSGARA